MNYPAIIQLTWRAMLLSLVITAFAACSSDDTKTEWTKNAQWIGVYAPADSYRDTLGHACLPARYLKKTITLTNNAKQANLFVATGGYVDFYINGKAVSEEVMGPLPSDFDRTLWYRSYDVTPLLENGENIIFACLSSGYFTGMLKRYRMPDWGVPRVMACLKIETADGTQYIPTDNTWQASDDGPIQSSNLYDGECYDARKEIITNWKNADILDAPKGVLREQTWTGMVRVDTVNAIRLWTGENGKIYADMGRNAVGWLKIKAQGKAAQPVIFRYAEILQADGKTLFTDNLRQARCTNVYFPASDGEFTYCPSTVYQGFRYVEIDGLTQMPEQQDIQTIVIADKMTPTATFSCSDTLLNRLLQAAYYGIQGNYHGFPTDCPQRDERLGWLGDRLTGCFGESYLFDNSNLYLKWLQDIEDTQNTDGQIADIAPQFWSGLRHANVTWTGAYISVAYMLYERYGIEDGFRLHYPSMRRWLHYTLKESMKDSVLTIDTYGDWCMPPEDLHLIHSKDSTRITEDAVLSTTVMYDLLQKMQVFAQLLNLKEDKAEYEQLAKNIRSAYNRRFYHYDTGGYSNQTVTANLLGLALGLVPDGEQKRVLDQVVRVTEIENNSHVSCGVLGIQHLMRTLTRNGRADLAYRIATQKSYPSWGYMLENGATTIWELWNGNTAAPEMNSGNHVMLLGDLLLWYFEDLAGIRPDKPAYQHLLMKPCFPEQLNEVNASYQSVKGTIVSHWQRLENGHIRWHINLPQGVGATIVTPDGNSREIAGNQTFVFIP